LKDEIWFRGDSKVILFPSLPQEWFLMGFGFCFQIEVAQFKTFRIGNHCKMPWSQQAPFHTIIPAFITKDESHLLSFGL